MVDPYVGAKKISVGKCETRPAGNTGELYQDAVKYPCFTQKVPSEQDLANPDSRPNPIDLGTVEAKLQRMLDIQGGGNIAGAYRSLNIEIPAYDQKTEISLGMYATQMVIRCNQDVTMVFNDLTNDTLFMQVADFPFSISDLKMTEAIHTIYVTTGSSTTTMKILAFGYKKI